MAYHDQRLESPHRRPLNRETQFTNMMMNLQYKINVEGEKFPVRQTYETPLLEEFWNPVLPIVVKTVPDPKVPPDYKLLRLECNNILRYFFLGHHTCSVGPGKCWRIHYARRKTDGREFSIWIYDKQQAEKMDYRYRHDHLERIRESVLIHNRLQHPKFLRVVHYIEECNNFIAFATEPISGCVNDLLVYLRTKSNEKPWIQQVRFLPEPYTLEEPEARRRLPEIPSQPPNKLHDYGYTTTELKHGLLEVYRAVQYLQHNQFAVHRNVCPLNVVITAKGVWKLCGFEFIENMKDSKYAYVPTYSIKLPRHAQPDLDYMDPETQTKGHCVYKNDLYSVALMFCTIFNHGFSFIRAQGNPILYMKQIRNLPLFVNSVMPYLPSPLNEIAYIALLNRGLTVFVQIFTPFVMEFSYQPNHTANILIFLEKVNILNPDIKNRYYANYMVPVMRQLPQRILWNRIWPVVIEDIKNSNIAIAVSYTILSMIKWGDKDNVNKFVTMFLMNINKLKNIASNITPIIYHIDLYLEKCTQKSKSLIMPILDKFCNETNAMVNWHILEAVDIAMMRKISDSRMSNVGYPFKENTEPTAGISGRSATKKYFTVDRGNTNRNGGPSTTNRITSDQRAISNKKETPNLNILAGKRRSLSRNIVTDPSAVSSSSRNANTNGITSRDVNMNESIIYSESDEMSVPKAMTGHSGNGAGVSESNTGPSGSGSFQSGINAGLSGSGSCQSGINAGLSDGGACFSGNDAGPSGSGNDAGPSGSGNDAGPSGSGNDAGPSGSGNDAGPSGSGNCPSGSDAGPNKNNASPIGSEGRSLYNGDHECSGRKSSFSLGDQTEVGSIISPNDRVRYIYETILKNSKSVFAYLKFLPIGCPQFIIPRLRPNLPNVYGPPPKTEEPKVPPLKKSASPKICITHSSASTSKSSPGTSATTLTPRSKTSTSPQKRRSPGATPSPPNDRLSPRSTPSPSTSGATLSPSAANRPKSRTSGNNLTVPSRSTGGSMPNTSSGTIFQKTSIESIRNRRSSATAQAHGSGISARASHLVNRGQRLFNRSSMYINRRTRPILNQISNGMNEIINRRL